MEETDRLLSREELSLEKEDNLIVSVSLAELIKIKNLCAVILEENSRLLKDYESLYSKYQKLKNKA